MEYLRISPRLATVKVEKRPLAYVPATAAAATAAQWQGQEGANGRTQNLLQLHNAGIGADAMDSLLLSGIGVSIVKDLAVGAITVRIVVLYGIIHDAGQFDDVEVR